MQKRIVYSKTEVGLVSQPLLATTEFIVINILPHANMIVINNLDGQTILYDYEPNINSIKKTAKAHAKKLGVRFGKIRRSE